MTAIALASGAVGCINAESKTTLPFNICSFIFFSNAVFAMLSAEATVAAAAAAAAVSLREYVNLRFRIHFKKKSRQQKIYCKTVAYPSCSTASGTNIGVILRLPSARRVSICFSIAFTGVMFCGITAGFVDICTEVISISPNCVEVLLLLTLLMLPMLLLVLLMLMLLLLLNDISFINLLSSGFKSSQYSGTIPLSTLDSLILRSILLPYSRWNIVFCTKKRMR